MNAPARAPADPIRDAFVKAHRAREVYPTGHLIKMTREVDERSRALSVATCECGVKIKLLSTKHEEMDAAIEAHWQRFDHADDRGQPIEDLVPDENEPNKPEIAASTSAAMKPAGAAAPVTASAGGNSTPPPADDDDYLLRLAETLAWRDDEPAPIAMPPGDPTRPVLRWHGGKWKLADWIIRHFPKHRVYTETFGGAASVLVRKPRSYCEVYNDLDDWVVMLFRVLREPDQSERLRQALLLTPFSRAEFEVGRQLQEAEGEPVELCRRLIVRSFMGFGSNAHNGRSTGFRANSNRSGTTPAHDWTNYADVLPAFTERLRGIVIEHRPAIDVMRAHDGPETLHYVDPPYMPDTRSPANKYDLKYRMYRHELDRDGHVALLTDLQTLLGMVVLSGYPHKLYDEMLQGWRRIETEAHADGARDRIEVLWLNPACAQALDAQEPALFDLAQFDQANTPPGLSGGG